MFGSMSNSSHEVWSLMELPGHQARDASLSLFKGLVPEKKCDGPTCGNNREERPSRLNLPIAVSLQHRFIGLHAAPVELPNPTLESFVTVDRNFRELRSVEAPFRPPIRPWFL